MIKYTIKTNLREFEIEVDKNIEDTELYEEIKKYLKEGEVAFLVSKESEAYF